MPVHPVAEGESIFALAHGAGMEWRAIWEHERNGPLRAKSHDPGTLAVGEECFVPERTQHVRVHDRGEPHVFVLRRPTTRLRLRLCRGGQALARLDFTLKVPGQADIDDTTGDHGELDVEVPATATAGALRVGGRTYTLRLQHLAPYDSDRGVQQRLRNLGHASVGDPPGVVGPGTLAAFNAWRATQGLAPIGAIDAGARVALRDGHGC